MMLPVLTHHIRYHQCLMHLDQLIGYVFSERCLLQVSTAHCSNTDATRQSEISGLYDKDTIFYHPLKIQYNIQDPPTTV